MYACIHETGPPKSALLLNCAYAFSPQVEQTAADTVVLNIGGLEQLFGSPCDIAQRIARLASELRLTVAVAVAQNPDAAIHAARGFGGVTIIPAGEESSVLGSLSLDVLSPSLAGVESERALEIANTLHLWGIRSFREFAALPEAAIAERLGAEGVRLQQLARGSSRRSLFPDNPAPVFEKSLELEDSVALLEPLSFILASLLNQLSAALKARALATNELRFQLKLEDRSVLERTLHLPFPMRDPKVLLKLLQFDLELNPPQAPVVKVSLAAEPVKPRVIQAGLFHPSSPEPEKLELTVARIARWVGPDNVGSPELLDTHRPDAFQMKRFDAAGNSRPNPQPAPRSRKSFLGFRVFRPPLPARVETIQDCPSWVRTKPQAGDRPQLRGKVISYAGPWKVSGNWWSLEAWGREEWDIALGDGVLCRIFRDLQMDSWFIEGIYD
jgi:protein ImuB